MKLPNYTNTKEVEKVLNQIGYNNEREYTIMKAYLFLRGKHGMKAKISNVDICDVANDWIK